MGDEGGGGTEVGEVGLAEGDTANGLVVSVGHWGVARGGGGQGDCFGMVIALLLHAGYAMAATAFTMGNGGVGGFGGGFGGG